MSASKALDAEVFEKEVIAGSLPAVVDFTATWCGPCQALAPAMDELAKEFDGRVFIGKVDIDENRELASRFGVQSVPTVLFFKGGENVDQLLGNFPDKIRKKIQELL